MYPDCVESPLESFTEIVFPWVIESSRLRFLPVQGATSIKRCVARSIMRVTFLRYVRISRRAACPAASCFPMSNPSRHVTDGGFIISWSLTRSSVNDKLQFVNYLSFLPSIKFKIILLLLVSCIVEVNRVLFSCINILKFKKTFKTIKIYRYLKNEAHVKFHYFHLSYIYPTFLYLCF